MDVVRTGYRQAGQEPARIVLRRQHAGAAEHSTGARVAGRTIVYILALTHKLNDINQQTASNPIIHSLKQIHIRFPNTSKNAVLLRPCPPRLRCRRSGRSLRPRRHHPDAHPPCHQPGLECPGHQPVGLVRHHEQRPGRLRPLPGQQHQLQREVHLRGQQGHPVPVRLRRQRPPLPVVRGLPDLCSWVSAEMKDAAHE